MTFFLSRNFRFICIFIFLIEKNVFEIFFLVFSFLSCIMPNPCQWRHAAPSGPPVGAANATPNFGKSRKSAKLVMIFDLKNIDFFLKMSTFPSKCQLLQNSPKFGVSAHSNASISVLRRSWLGKRLLWRTNCSPYSTCSKFLGLWKVWKHHF